MNTLTRGVRNAFRNTVRTISIVVMLSLSIGLIIAMLAAKSGVEAKIESIKSSAGNTITISPAGFRGFEGGGSALTSEQIASVASLDNVETVTSSFSDRLTTDDTTSLQSAIEAGALGGRFGAEQESTDTQSAMPTPDASSSETTATTRPNPFSSITITGVDSVASAAVFGGSTVTWTSGEAFDPSTDANNAVVGSSLAEKNALSVGDTFTAYGETLTVVGIYDAGTDFANNGVFVSLRALQRLSDQADSITNATVTVDSIDNLTSVTDAIEGNLGDSADVVNTQDTATQLASSLESVRGITLFTLIGAVIAGAAIILLTMIMIVRERRREVGVMKAVGASNRSIVRQFVAEAMTLTTLALVVGIGLGIVAATPLTSTLVETSSTSSESITMGRGGPGGGGPMRGIVQNSQQTLENITGSVGLETIAYGILATIVIAVLGSAIPAHMISKIRPAEAMRSE